MDVITPESSTAMGMTLIEVVVALVILVIGTTAVVRMVSGTGRAVALGAEDVEVLSVGMNRVEGLAVSGCAAPQAGMAAAGGMGIRWWTQRKGSLNEVTVLIRSRGWFGVRIDTLTLGVWCRS